MTEQEEWDEAVVNDREEVWEDLVYERDHILDVISHWRNDLREVTDLMGVIIDAVEAEDNDG